MRKMFLAAGLMAAATVTGGLAVAPAGAATQSGAGGADGPGYCGPLHEDNTVPSKDRPRAESQPGRGERGGLTGNYCSGDTGNAKPAPRGDTPPAG